jgi:hypothetical protein
MLSIFLKGKRKLFSAPDECSHNIMSVTHKASDHHLQCEQQCLAAMTPSASSALQLPMADVDKHIIICPNFRATNYTEICILGFCSISGSNRKT